MDVSAVALLAWLVSGAGLVLGGVGSVLGLMSWRRNRMLKVRLAQLEAQGKAEREREARRAKLRAFIDQVLEMKSYLVIQNDGPGHAHDLTVSINGSALDEDSIIAREALDRAKIGGVKAQAGLRIPINSSTAPDKLQLDVTWSDDSGNLGFYQVELDR